MKVLYTAEALSTGAGRVGHVRSTDGSVDLDLRIPREMGGPGGGANPEVLFAAGCSACFHSALQNVARERSVDISGSSVGARVQFLVSPEGSYDLAVQLEVALPGQERAEALALAEAAHEVCPYSRATRGNIEVSLSVDDD